VEWIEAGESVGFGRAWVAEKPTWTVLLSIGHTHAFLITAFKERMPRRLVWGSG
jgi:alanine racemase